MVQQLSKSGPKESPLLKAGHPPAGKTRSHASTRVFFFFCFDYTKPSVVVFHSSTQIQLRVHRHSSAPHVVFSNPVLMHTVLHCSLVEGNT